MSGNILQIGWKDTTDVLESNDLIPIMDNELQVIQNLLDRIKEITEQGVTAKKEREKSGTLYNIFDVLGLSASEVRLHSAFIASLLRPNNHGAGRRFLEAFLKMPSLKLPDNFMDIQKVQVETEKYIGRVEEEKGGRIDLFISDGKNHIIIENKIYAGDQKNQLLRYHNYKPDGVLVYLTLFDGEEPAKESLGSLDPGSVLCISYESHILPWLEECVRIASDLPHIRETINQYINTIRKLTETDIDMGTNKKIIELLKQPENYDAMFGIWNNLNASMNEVMNAFVKQLEKELARVESPFTCKPNGADWFQSYMRIDFIHKNWEKVVFSIEFEARGFRNMIVGFLRRTHVEDIRAVAGAKKLADEYGLSKENTNWFWGAPPSSFKIPTYWNNAQVMKSLTDGTMIRHFLEMLKDVDQRSEGLGL